MGTTYDSNNNGKIYTVPLEDSNGEIVLVKAFAVEKILEEKTGRDEVKFNHEDFPHLSKKVLQEAGKSLPRKYLDLLIGNPNLALQPVCQSGYGCQDCAKGRCLYRSRFGTGYVPLGSFGKDNSHVSAIGHVALNRVSPPLQGLFFQGESLGVSPVERCTHCKLRIAECRICSIDTAILTADEEEEYNILKEHVTLNELSGHLQAKYPFKKDPAVLIDNSKEAKACQINQEKRQLKNNIHSQYVEQFTDMLERGVITEISQGEIAAYTGPVNFITHHEVYKPGSLSTPVRLVSNSSFRNGSTNLNDISVKGPNTLADIYNNLFKFRSYQVALIFDITKAYNSIKTGLVEKHLRRLWFRQNPQLEDCKMYGFNCVQFGDRPAAALMTIAVEKAAKTYEDIAVELNIPVQEVKDDSKKLLEDTYVDDGTTGGSKKEVDRMIGVRLPDGNFSGTIPSMMKKVGLKLKTIVTSHSKDQEALSKLSDKVLGCLYDPVQDLIGIKFSFNPAKKRKGAKVKPDLTLQDVDAFIKSPQTRRSLLSLCNGIYDPLGLAAPYTIKLKLLMKDTLSVENPGDWDSPVSGKLVKEWSMAVKEGISQDSLWFPRSTASPRAVKKPRLVGFWDGSFQAFSAVIYAVTMVSKTEDPNLDVLPDGDIEDKDFDPERHEFVSHILAAKARVTPLKTGLTIPRAEVSGLLLCSRRMSKAVSLYDGGFSVASCLGDSTCVISALEKNATSFNPYMHARLLEIFNLREKIAGRTHLEEVFHVISLENIADICTRRESSLHKLGPGSVWQSGPHWLREPRYNWPCNRDFTFKELPSEETKTPIRVVMAAKASNSPTYSMVQFVLNQYWTFSEAAFSLAKTISAVKRIRGDFAPLNDCIKQAKSLMFEESMKETDELITRGRLTGYDIQTKEGINRPIHYTTGRFGKETLMKLYGINELPVIHNSTSPSS